MLRALVNVSSDTFGTEYVELQRLISLTLWSLILLVAFTLIIQIMGGSLTLGAFLVDASTGLILQIFNMVSIGIILRQNAFSHPYGTGKLENFAGFLYAVVVIPGGMWILYSAHSSYMQPPAAANLGLATLPIAISLARSIWLYWIARRIVQRYAHHSPFTSSYHVATRVSVVTDALLLTGVLIGFSASLTNQGELSVYFDIAIASLISLYLVHSAIKVLRDNFKSLIDLPLPEVDQIKIMQALAMHFEAYEDLGNIYTQLSGSTRLVQIELYVKPNTRAAEIQLLSSNMENHLKQHFGKLLFHLIPLVRDHAVATCIQPKASGTMALCERSK